MKKLNFLNILIIIAIIIGSFFIKKNVEVILNNLKDIISSPWFFWTITIIIVPIQILSKIRYGDFKLPEILNESKFSEVVSELVSLVAEPSTIICSISILKGLALDYFYQDSYFSKFCDAEKTFIFITTMYFFTLAFISLKGDVKKLFIKSEDVH